MLIRKIKEADLEGLQKVYLELCEDESNLEQMKEKFRAIDGNEDYYLLWAEVEGKIVGTVMGIVCHDLVGNFKAFMTVENVVVMENYRGRGICKALFQELERIAIERECTYIYLVSGETRKVAHQMYHKLGFRSDNVVGFRKYLNKA